MIDVQGRSETIDPRPKVILALGVAGAGFGVATIVQAAIPDSNRTIHGCYQFATASVPKGTLRVIDPREVCMYYERPLNWNGNTVGGILAISHPIDQSIPGGKPPPGGH